MPQRVRMLLDPRRDEDKLPRGPNLDDARSSLAGERLTSDDVLPLASLRVALPLDDLAREDDVLDVEDADVVIVQLSGCVKGNEILALADHLPKPVQDPRCHRQSIVAWY